jgi:K+-sensing histidine kinase KdpD
VTVELQITDMLVSVDMDQIQQAFLNLLINGAQAMEGHGRITISNSEEGDQCVIAIRDEGPGIPLEAREHLFRAVFSRPNTAAPAWASLPPAESSTAHGGTLTLDCPEGGGTIARITVPSARA